MKGSETTNKGDNMTTKNASETRVIQLTKNGAREIWADETINLFGEGWQAKDKNGYGSSYTTCVFCGRDTSKQGNSKGVIVSGGGASIIHKEDYEKESGDAGFMGWFPVGSECIKVVPKEFRVNKKIEVAFLSRSSSWRTSNKVEG